MFNIFKVAHYFQNVPNFTQLPGTFIPEHVCSLEEGHQPSHLYFARNYTDSPRKQTGSKQNVEDIAQQKGDQEKKSKRKNKNNDNNDNNGGGFLEPIIEDLQGFLKGRRSPASPALIHL